MATKKAAGTCTARGCTFPTRGNGHGGLRPDGMCSGHASIADKHQEAGGRGEDRKLLMPRAEAVAWAQTQRLSPEVKARLAAKVVAA